VRTHAGLHAVYLTDIVEASLESWSSYYETHLHKLHDEQHLHSLQEPAMDNAVATLRIRAELVQSEPRNQPQLKQSTTTETLVGTCSGTILTPNTLSRPGSSQSAAQAQEARRQANHHRHLQGPFSSHFRNPFGSISALCLEAGVDTDVWERVEGAGKWEASEALRSSARITVLSADLRFHAPRAMCLFLDRDQCF